MSEQNPQYSQQNIIVQPPAPVYIVPGSRYVLPTKKADREARMMLATGEKGVGKTWQTVQTLVSDYVCPPPGTQKPRRGLILDINDEYGEFNIPAIAISNIPKFNHHPKIELRRIRPFHFDGKGTAKKMGIDEILKSLHVILDTFRGGCLLIEDISKMVSGNLKQDLLGAICTNRHLDCDIIMHYQNINRPLPAIWENTNVIRFHHQKTSVYISEDKITNIEIFRIAQVLVDARYRAGDTRFYVYIDLDKNKLYGNFNGKEFAEAIQQTIVERGNQYIAPLLKMTNSAGKKIYDNHSALMKNLKEKFADYWGNTPISLTQVNNIFGG